jgi:hypothetical protein
MVCAASSPGTAGVHSMNESRTLGRKNWQRRADYEALWCVPAGGTRDFS